MARFKIDENLPAAIAQLLREAGHDAVTVGEQGLRGVTDADLDAVCRAERRAVVTLDRGFGDVRRHPPRGAAGILILRMESQSSDAALLLMKRLLPALRENSLQDTLWIVDENKIRIREG